MTDIPVSDQASLNAILAGSSALMKQGLKLVQQSARGDAREPLHAAIKCFGEAARLRETLPLDACPAFRYDLAACYLNRAEALLKIDDAASARSAIVALDDGICWLETLPLSEDPRFVRRLAVAWQNRGLARLRDEHARTAGEEDLRAAVALLSRSDLPMPEDRDHLLAAASVNLAACLAARVEADADPFAHQALELQRPVERTSRLAAAVTLQARHVLCRRLAAGDAAAQRDRCADATDLAEEALSVIAYWERSGADAFRSLGFDFVAFGASAYAAYQPQFLEEFLCEWLDPSRSSAGFANAPEIAQAADRARAAARQAAPIFFTLGSGFQSSAHLRSRL